MKFTKIWIKFKPFYTALVLIRPLCTKKKKKKKPSLLNATYIFKKPECAPSLILKCTVCQFIFSVRGECEGSREGQKR